MADCQMGGYRCPLEATIDLIGGKWKCLILWHLSGRVLRFGQLHQLMPKATQKMLTQQLRDLERDGLVVRTVYPEVPPHVEYALTERGRSLLPLLYALCDRGEQYLRERQSSAQ